MKINGTSKSGLFLIEMMFVILFFAISGAICLQMFAHASTTAQQAEDLNQATMVARSAAACYQASQGDLDDVANILSGNVESDTLTIAYDGDWNSSAQTTAYTLVLIQQGATADIAIYTATGDTPIYTLTVAALGGGGL
ncbi:MAG: hypothetical protein R3Y62_02855 [Eubacteriales bacterium]